MAYSYRITTMSNVQVVRRDYLTARDVAVAVNEDLIPTAELRIMAVPGTSGGTATIVRRTNGVNGTGKTFPANSPFYAPVSMLRHVMQNVVVPYKKTGQSP